MTAEITALLLLAVVFVAAAATTAVLPITRPARDSPQRASPPLTVSGGEARWVADCSLAALVARRHPRAFRVNVPGLSAYADVHLLSLLCFF